MIRLFFVQGKVARAEHTMVVCEHLAIRRLVQKESIRTIFLIKVLVFNKYRCIFALEMREERDEGT